MNAEEPLHCYHCGENVPADCFLSTVIDGDEQPMCCPGCKAVAELISGSGMESFYRLRTGFNEKPEPSESTSAYGIYDSSKNSADFAEQLEDGSWRARLLLGGISCAACTWLIETVLTRNAAISKASVNLAQQSLLVEWNPEELALSQIFAKVQALGYEPHPWQAHRGAALVQNEQRKSLRQLAVAGLAMMQVGMFGIALHAGDLQGMEDEYRGLLRSVSLIVATVVVFYSATSFFRNAWTNLKQGRLVMDLPVALAIGLAYGASAYATFSNQGQVYFDSVAMFTFFLLLGRFLERRVRHKELLRQTDLYTLLPASCQRQLADSWEICASREIVAGDILLVKSGSLVPADGVVTQGTASINEAAFTGEDLPRPVTPGASVTAGTLLVEGNLQLRASADAGNTRIAAMMRVLAQAEHAKPKLAQLADRVAAWFVSAVLLATAAVALYWWQQAGAEQALWVSLAVLVVSCPCALSLATPTALATATTRLREKGVLITTEDTLERINRCSQVIFDKTGTLTSGNFKRGEVEVYAGSMHESLAIAAALETHSNHPVAAAFADIDSRALPGNAMVDVQVTPGQGIRGSSAGVEYAIGGEAYCRQFLPSLQSGPAAPGHWIALCSRSETLAWIRLEDQLRPEASEVMQELRQRGLSLTILSGDPSSHVAQCAQATGITNYYAGCSPADKLAYIQQQQAQGHQVAMVGDGLNDAPVLAAADCAFAVNGATDLAKSRADAIFLTPDLNRLLYTMNIATRSRRTIIQNMGWALGYNGLALPLAAVGLVPPWAAAIGMSLSSLLVVTNSLRIKH